MPRFPSRCTAFLARSTAVGLTLGLLLPAGLWAGTLQTDFTVDPGGVPLGKAKIDNGILKLQDLQEYIDGESGLPMHGSYVFPPLDGDARVAAFTATFRVSIHGGTEQPAQGFSLVLAEDIGGLTAPFREGAAAARGW
ncbi:MAG: hypothetical protein M5U12_11150 [Verrucomicrobia bacterium]|nr:hypothetical protein [Verrucomicrobiota bacterium]